MNDLAQQQNNNSVIAIEQSRAIQEVQGAVIVAKRFPRDEAKSYNKIIQACNRKTLAESAMYAYSKGGTLVTGASIRLAETLAKYWGNIQFGISELSQENGSSEVMAYAWDLETNTRQIKQFKVPHIRYSKKKGNTKLTDPRDIYEMTANQGARRLRACILGVLPSDITEEAINQCEKTLQGDGKEPLPDRVRKCVASFAEIGVTSEMIEKRLGHRLEAINPYELINLGKIYNSIKDNMGGIGDYFDMGGIKKTEAGKDDKINSLLKNEQNKTADKTAKPEEKSKVQKTHITNSDKSDTKPQESQEVEKNATTTPNPKLDQDIQSSLFNLIKSNLEDEQISAKDKMAFWFDKKPQIEQLPEEQQKELTELYQSKVSN